MINGVAPTWIQLGTELQTALTTYLWYVIGAGALIYIALKDKIKAKGSSKPR